MRPHEGNGINRRNPVKYSQAGEHRAGAASTAAAGNLDALADGALMHLPNRCGGLGVVGR